MEIKKETLRFDRMETVSCAAAVSAREPLEDGWEVLSGTANACVARGEVVQREVMAEGTVVFCAVLKNGDGQYKKVERVERFSASVPLDGADAQSSVLWQANAEKVRVCAEAGHLLFSCRAALNGVVVIPCEKETASLSGDETLKTRQSVCACVCVKEAAPLRFTQAFEIELSPRMPEARAVLCVSASAFAREVHLSAGQLVLGGRLTAQTTYLSDDEYEPLLQVSDEEEFSQIIELNREPGDGRAVVSLCVESIESEVLPNEEGERRLIRLKAELCGFALIAENREISLLEDAYSLTSHLSCVREALSFCRAGETVSRSFNRSVQVSLPEGKPPISRVNAVSFRPSLTFDDGAFTGSAEVGVLYTASGTGETEGFSVSVPLSFRDVQAPFEEDVCGVIGQIGLSDMQAVPVSGRELEVRAGFSVTLMPLFAHSCESVRDVTEEEETPSEYGFVLYKTGKNETLWDVGKQFGVDENDLLAFNPGVTSPLTEGETLIVFRPLAG